MILIDYKDNRPIYEQIIEKFQELMVLGILEEDAQMPSVRNMALELSLNPNTIQRAYAELESQGFIYSVRGKGSFVGSISKIREKKKQELDDKMLGIAREAKTLGITKDEFMDCAKRQYYEESLSSTGKGEAGGREHDTGSSADETV